MTDHAQNRPCGSDRAPADLRSHLDELRRTADRRARVRNLLASSSRKTTNGALLVLLAVTVLSAVVPIFLVLTLVAIAVI